MGLGTFLGGKYETEPGTTGWGPVADGDVYGRNLERQNWDNRGKDFLNVFSSDLADRQKRTDAAQSQGSKGGIAKDPESKKGSSTPGMSRIAPDIAVQQGYRGKEYTIAGTPPKKGWGGTLMRGAGALFGPVGAVAGNVAADASGADYW
jgi:hypothetical protein